MKLKLYSIALLVAVVTAFSATSCKEEWDAHYSTLPANKSDLNLYEFIKSQSNLSTFAQMLHVTGYDSILSKPQTFTVWAPSDEALAGLNANDPALALEIVKNHITRFTYTTSGIVKNTMLMLNSKLISFEKQADGYYFNEKKITQPDLAASNGMLHILGRYAPYKKNIWEFINTAPGLDSLRTYINSLTVRQFDVEASYKDGVLVDSIFKIANPVLDRLAKLNVEDSTYTALLPDNNAWSEAYTSIYPYFKTLESEGGLSQQRQSAMWNIVKDLFFRSRVQAPVDVNPLISTNRSRFYNPDFLFQGKNPEIMSNGYSYIHNKWLIPDSATWKKPISIEAETGYYGRIVSNYTLSTNSSLGTGYNLSNDSYIMLRDATLNSVTRPYVSFPIPNTLSTKYNVYVVFVPRTILDPNDLRPYRVKFYLNYTNQNGVQVNYAAVGADNKVLATTSHTTAVEYRTKPGEVDKVLAIKDFELPFSNTVFTSYLDTQMAKEIRVILRVENATPKTNAEMTNFSRDLLIDRVIFEPVQ